MPLEVAQPRSRFASVVGLIVALGSAFLIPFLPGQAHQNIADARQDTVLLAFEWFIALAILTIVVFWERLPLRSIGFRSASPRDFIWMGVAFAGMFVALGVYGALTHASGSTVGGITPAQIATVPLVLRIALFLTAGFCEELMFRAYAIERLALFTGNLWLGGAAAVVLFTLGHLPRYGFSYDLVGVAVIALFLTALYLKTRNFWLCAYMHAFIDCIGLVVVPALAVHHL